MRAAVLEHGPGVTLETVARSLRVTGPALLKRFGSRRALLLQALRIPDPAGLFLRFQAPLDERPLAEQLESLLGALWDFIAEAVPRLAALRESGIPHHEVFDKRGNAPERIITLMHGWLESACAEGLAEGEALDVVATAMLGAVQTHVFTAHLSKRSLTARHRRAWLERLSRFFARALSPAPRRRGGDAKRGQS